MKKSTVLIGLANLAAWAVLITPACAIERTVVVSGDSFLAYFGPTPAPIDPFAGTFMINLDPSKAYAGDSTDIVEESLSFKPLSNNFSYDPSSGTLAIGSKTTGGGSFAIGSPGDYGFVIYNFLSSPTLVYTQYFDANGGDYYTPYYSGTISVAAVPEPATWAIMLIGFGATGSALRIRRQAARRSGTPIAA